MKKFIALLMKEKKTKNQWENNESGFLLALYSVYKKLGQFFFSILYLLTCLKNDISVQLQVINIWTIQ